MNRKKEKYSILSNAQWILKLNFKYLPFVAMIRILGLTGSNIVPLISSFIVSIVIDTIISNQANNDKSYIIFCLILFAASYILKAVIDIFRNYGQNIPGFKLSYAIPQTLLHEKLNAFNISTLENPNVQNMINRYHENSNEFEHSTQSIISIICFIIPLFIVIIPILKLSPLLVIFLIISSIPGIFTSKIIFEKLFMLSKDTTVLSRTGGNIVSMITQPETLKEIRLLKAYKYLRQFFDKYIEIYDKGKTKIYNLWSLYDILNSILTATVIIYGIYLTITSFSNGFITIGQIAFYIAAISSVGGYIDAISVYISSFAGSNIKIAEMRELLEMENSKTENKEIFISKQTPPIIKLDNISFHYPESNTNIIENLNLIIKSGEKIAIVGENGAGKTTLIKLISNIYPVSLGTIWVDDKNISSLDPNSWYENIGVLYQDYNTYNVLSVAENIALGRINEGINMDKVEESAKKADAYEFIMKYKNKYNQILSEKYEDGVRPSTGQWQKLAIARFFYRDAPILILDEPTASIDAVAESNIFDRIYEFIENKTVIIVSHRFSTVRKANRIIVFDKGKIVEEGTHQELLDKHGKYEYAFKLQATGYKE